MGKVIVYTFRTYKYIDQLEVVYGRKPFILGELKRDLLLLCTRLSREKPKIVFGIASTRGNSMIETVTVNNIHDHKINPDGEEIYELFVPSPTVFDLSSCTTRTFCNYSMYKIAEHIKINNLDTKFIFVHLNQNDSEQVKDLLNNLA